MALSKQLVDQVKAWVFIDPFATHSLNSKIRLGITTSNISVLRIFLRQKLGVPSIEPIKFQSLSCCHGKIMGRAS